MLLDARQREELGESDVGHESIVADVQEAAADVVWMRMLVWMDLEMTGLDHTSDVIVEIATLITDDELMSSPKAPIS